MAEETAMLGRKPLNTEAMPHKVDNDLRIILASPRDEASGATGIRQQFRSFLRRVFLFAFGIRKESIRSEP